jgi:hypothetical protein
MMMWLGGVMIKGHSEPWRRATGHRAIPGETGGETEEAVHGCLLDVLHGALEGAERLPTLRDPVGLAGLRGLLTEALRCVATLERGSPLAGPVSQEMIDDE